MKIDGVYVSITVDQMDSAGEGFIHVHEHDPANYVADFRNCERVVGFAADVKSGDI
jgi:hypothetical protein